VRAIRKIRLAPPVAAAQASVVPKTAPNMKPPATVRALAPGNDTATAAQ
jgi:hypothetical protein